MLKLIEQRDVNVLDVENYSHYQEDLLCYENGASIESFVPGECMGSFVTGCD